MLVNMKEMLKKAYLNNYCVPQFNINNLEWTRYILEASESVKSPVILGASEGAIKYFGGYSTVVAVVNSLIKDLNISIPVTLHLDHGSSYESCVKAIDAGFSSVMIDASKYSLEENIRITSLVVNYASERNISVEAEIGHIGGNEDGVVGEVYYTNLEDAKKLYEMTKIDFLAPALGSVHGLYVGEPKLNFEVMKEISDSLKIPLVLHGGTGIPDDLIKKAIICGISKLNINTELQIVWTKAVREFLNNNEDVYDPRKVIKSGESAIKDSVITKINLLGSNNQANM